MTLAALCAVPLYADSMFISNLTDVPVGTPTGFSQTNNGVTATFSSPADAAGGGFTTDNSFFSWGPEALDDPGPAGASGIPLDIGFSSALSSISMDFATITPSPFNLSAYLGTTLVGSVNAAGTVPNGFNFPEGTISFNGAAFNNVVLTGASTPDFAVGNIDVTVSASATPEPSYALIFPALGFGLFVLNRRQRTTRN